MKKLFIMLMVGLTILMATVSCNETTKENWDKVESVEDYIYETYFSMEDLPRKSYDIKTYWKNNELQYVTVQYTKNEGVEVWTYVAIFDNKLEVVDGLAGTNRENVWEDVYEITEGL
jgi:hypothetical protein